MSLPQIILTEEEHSKFRRKEWLRLFYIQSLGASESVDGIKLKDGDRVMAVYGASKEVGEVILDRRSRVLHLSR